jgi:hypothetical protein
MDGASNMDPSNAMHALTASARVTKKLSMCSTTDAAAVKKLVPHIGKALKSAEKNEGKAEKECSSAQAMGRQDTSPTWC